MEAEIFDKETILDLMVNFIPLGIIFFFIAAFVLYDPWGFDPRFSGLMLAIMGSMFVALAVLTYVSGKAIAGDEKRATVYPQGQAGLKGAKPIHEHDHDEVDEESEDGETDEIGPTDEATVDSDVSETDSNSSETAAESDGTTDATPDAETDAKADATPDAETDAKADATSDTEADVDSERNK